MFQIREAQLAAFENCARERLAHELVAGLRANDASTVTVPNEEILLQRIRDAISYACNLGFHREGTLRAFVVLMLDFHPRYLHHPDVTRLLKDTSRTPEQRMQSLLHWAASASWAVRPDYPKTGLW